jgi:hypothetical protein
MIGTHGYRRLCSSLKQHDLFYNSRHIGIAAKVIGFEEISVGISLGIPEMKEMNMIAESTNHSGEVVVGTNAI